MPVSPDYSWQAFEVINIINYRTDPDTHVPEHYETHLRICNYIPTHTRVLTEHTSCAVNRMVA